jgi:hypothetical protein
MISLISGCIEESKSKNDDNDIEPPPVVDENLTKLQVINEKGLAWVQTLDVDPNKLRNEMGIKGKKKFVELLDIYLCFYQNANTSQKKTEFKGLVEELINVTYQDEYHDMNEINDTQFRQDSTSYLRAWYLINEFGFNTTYYKSEIENVLPRLDAHLPSRGINQRMAFVFYYGELGFPIDYTLEELFNSSVIRRHNEPNELSDYDVYYITHEIFFLYDDNKMDLLTEVDIQYLNSTLAYQVNKTIAENNVDLLAEVLWIMTYLGFQEIPEYNQALDYLLVSQNSNGSFGNYEDARKYYQEQGINIDVDILLYLHTTEVTLRALNLAILGE